MLVATSPSCAAPCVNAKLSQSPPFRQRRRGHLAVQQQRISSSAASRAPTSSGSNAGLNSTSSTNSSSSKSSPRGPPLPESAAYQQTLRRSFTLGGIGLHTGEYALVRVMPAFAGEGRYFVRMKPGTNEHLWDVEQPAARELEETGVNVIKPANTATEVANAKLFFEFIQNQEAGSVSGTFADYVQQRASSHPDTLLIDADAELLPEEQPAAGHTGEIRLPAHVHSMQHGSRWCSVLANDGAEVWGAEHLLAALECCGVDNARIEVEGGKEVPVIDGSALAWAVEVQRAGLRPAPGPLAADGLAARSICTPLEMVTVRDGNAFITFFPGPTARVTVGIDYMRDAPMIGRQWFSWSPEDPSYNPSDHFRFALAPARMVFPTEQAVLAILAEGMLQGGPDHVSLIADQDDWLDPSLVRFPSDEAARHAVVDLLGDLSLLAQPGNRGLPEGHVVAYEPTHALHAEFVRHLMRSSSSVAS